MNIYERAEQKGCQLEDTCVSCGSQYKWDEYMKGARPANQKKVVKVALQAGVIDDWQAKQERKNRYFNPYNHFITKTHVVYVHSGIEHFIKVNS